MMYCRLNVQAKYTFSLYVLLLAMLFITVVERNWGMVLLSVRIDMSVSRFVFEAGHWWYTPLIPALGMQAEAGRFLSSMPAWSTVWVPGQPGLHWETMSQETKQKTNKQTKICVWGQRTRFHTFLHSTQCLKPCSFCALLCLDVAYSLDSLEYPCSLIYQICISP